MLYLFPRRLLERTMNALSENCLCDSDEFCSYSSVLGLFYPAGCSLVLLSCLEEGLTAAAAAAAGAARITKVKDYLHMVFLTRKREVL